MQKKYAKMLYSSPIGCLSLVADDQYLYGIWVQEQKHFERGLGDETIEAVVSHPILDPVIACLDAYFKGKSRDLSNLPLAPIGTNFEKRVWSYLQEIPYGQTVTYGQNSPRVASGFCSSNWWSSGAESLVYPSTLSSCAGRRQASDRLCCRSGKESLALGA